ncbi:hypothetical protein Plano_2847 [Planococcus sp. PAMC 21323]|uniref:hypothetical protein n=1 Tax=Planococcus sp. PAMC 21323 TaxID=1526927 RepID=UPI000585D395|nr:hypothetical protein [Planococcus sp. PAMC 21323]AIY06812.1 hypothetical protein Plano_2847 [Planococcus sp. PAMC 21323]
MNSYNLDEFEIDKKKLEIMKLKIIREEKQNVKTKDKTKDAMIEKIKGIIIEEVKTKY